MNKKDLDWQKSHKEISETRELEKSFHIGVGNDPDKFLALLQGKFKAPPLPGEDIDKIQKPISYSGFKGSNYQMKTNSDRVRNNNQTEQTEDESINYTVEETPSHKNSYSNSTILNEIEKISFIKDQNRQGDIEAAVIKAVRANVFNEIIKDVAKNTKNVFKDLYKKASVVPGGIKVVFNIEDSDFTVTASGKFYGDEVICLHNQNGETKASIIRICENDKWADLTDQFEIKLS